MAAQLGSSGTWYSASQRTRLVAGMVVLRHDRRVSAGAERTARIDIPSNPDSTKGVKTPPGRLISRVTAIGIDLVPSASRATTQPGEQVHVTRLCLLRLSRGRAFTNDA